ncbi:uncharacterized protein SPPG_05346 [Spizellomyces punctatus DAOM BR117]|uniref:carnosine N-methyltransferase n=1 Tax=Spizellomyces punctatus (strain DAOM BR117) TaxID=645134 RepID=A0A0L0HG13_SPIPD|nr:uncharacterized protein SPPG_05346 [Spizellomyces punctatus DAOM BR117]KNC99971.1 hypothetical protein SPPG_05346 [Spizellomyces punctatus DAOM BR117]|eukprot:XP_016608011.1 hypothetical protein SPPG_05346 [Spizellomyces punctatus DAOM BR117]
MFLNDPDTVPEADRLLEAQHFAKVIEAFNHYRLHSLSRNAKRRRDLASIPKAHQQLVGSFMEKKINSVEERILKNAAFIASIVAGHQNEETNGGTKSQVSEGDMDKVRSTLRQFVRDWSEEGREERARTYDPILDELQTRFKGVSMEDKGKIKVLVPGAGLGRLAYDIVKQGYSCQGNEFSFYMLLASHFVLNQTQQLHQYEIFPWIHSFSNSTSTDVLLSSVRIPDVLPGDVPRTADFSMVAGDFCEVYGEEEHIESWDVVVTCFFMDTAKNIVEYIDIIKRILKPNGLWINLGPLLYHWEGMQNELSIELSLDEFKQVIRTKGFKIENERTIETTYASNTRGMLKYVYECAYFVGVKH